MASYRIIFTLFVLYLHAVQGSVNKRGPMSYVVERGCPFLTHYVRDNYFREDQTVSHDVNWVQVVYQAFNDNFVPLELFHGLVACGKDFALYGINSSPSIIARFNANFTIIPGVGR